MVFRAVEGVSEAEEFLLIDEEEVCGGVAQAFQIVFYGFFALANNYVYLLDTCVGCLLNGVVYHGPACNGEEFFGGGAGQREHSRAVPCGGHDGFCYHLKLSRFCLFC